MESGADSKRLVNNIIGAFTIKGLALVVNFFTIPMYMRYFNNNGILGVWYTILSMLSWIITFDLGIGNGLRNHLVEPLVKHDIIQIRKFLSSAYIVLGTVSIILACAGVLIGAVLDWNQIFNISIETISLKYLRVSLIISLIGIAFQFFFKLVLSVLNAMEKTALSNLIMLISNVLNLIYLLIFNYGTDTEKLLRISFAYSISINLPLLVSTMVIFSTILKGIRPSRANFDKNCAVKILNLGGSFFFVQIMFMIITSSNEFFISNIWGADKVVEFQVYNKVFYTFVTLYSLITNPIWSAITRAWKERQFNWIRKIYKWLLATSLIGVCGVSILAVGFQWIVDLWLQGNAIVVRPKIALAFAIYISIMFFVFAMTSVANGLQALKPQAIGFSLTVILKILFIYVGKDLWQSWDVIIWINIITLMPFVILQAVDIKNILKRI